MISPEYIKEALGVLMEAKAKKDRKRKNYAKAFGKCKFPVDPEPTPRKRSLRK